MCHEYTSRVWDRERDEADSEDDVPEFLNEEGSDDLEVLTDGGDES
ncbi:hypothetical protein [Halosimplex salinum]|nr:hypothetical protein [Halosimplex salinum]